MKKTTSILLLFIGLVLPSFGQTVKRIDGTNISVDSLGATIEILMKAAKVPGLCISIYNNNDPVFTKAYGLADVPANEPLKTSTILYAASFSKAVFAYLVMQLVEEKIIDLDTPLANYLKKPLPDYDIIGRDYKDLKGDERYKKITARMCLDHTTGFPNWREIEPDKKIKILYEPGTHYSYSGEGLCLLQFVLEQITNKDLETLARQRVFQPLKMENTSYVWQDRFKGNFASGHDLQEKPTEYYKPTQANAAGSMVTSFDDFVRFYTAIMHRKGLNAPGFDEMFRPQIRIRSKQQFGPESFINTTDNDNIELSYGLGFGVFHTPYGKAFFKEGHGDGWQHYCVAYPDKKIAVVIMTNSDNGESIFKALLAASISDTFTPCYWEGYAPIGNKAKDGYAYYCPPCGRSCDNIAHEYGGVCPVCKMAYVERKISITPR
jgi:serine-type D-Ala-D-Ala carboxypeptidase/endopeptidase